MLRYVLTYGMHIHHLCMFFIIRPPYGSQPSGNYRVPPGPGGMTNLQGQFAMGTPQQQQQQSFHMMHQQQPPQQHQPQGQTGGMAPHMYHSQPVAGIYVSER